jgi:hypothetical protein
VKLLPAEILSGWSDICRQNLPILSWLGEEHFKSRWRVEHAPA